MKKIAIISLGYMWFPCESGTSRFFYIANLFHENGYEVEVITTSFQHFEKKPRDQKRILSQGYPFKITFIDAPAYKKNIDIRRVYSNKVAEKNLRKYLKLHVKEYDAVYTSIPANNIAAMVTTVCKKNHVPCVLDIEDLWPEAMAMVVKNEKLRNFLFRGFLKEAEIAYANCSAVIGTSEDYTARAFKYNKRDIPHETVYVGCDIEAFDTGVKEYQDSIVKPDDEFWVTYAGSISTSYDIKTLILAANELLKQGETKIQFQLLGTGSQKEELENFVKEQNIVNVHFWGFVLYPKMCAVLSKSDVLVNSFVKGAPQSIVNKIGDYLAAGKPIINTLENPTFCRLIEENEVGVNVEAGDVASLNKVLSEIKSKADKLCVKGKNARRIGVEKFDRKINYKNIIKVFNTVTGEIE